GRFPRSIQRRSPIKILKNLKIESRFFCIVLDLLNFENYLGIYHNVTHKLRRLLGS
ncbi:hypothetical protein LEP1GSC128_2162, partial [Leptospira borgpetersenii str. 200801926]